MITAVDSSALLAIFKDEPGAERYLDLIHQSLGQGAVVACEIVVAEVGALFETPAAFKAVLDRLGVIMQPVSFESACEAGRIFRAYRQAGGRRDHLIPDFIIGAHALRQASARLIGADRGFFRTYFSSLHVLHR